MNVDKVLARLENPETRHVELRRAGRDLGDEFMRRRLSVIRALRAGVAKLSPASDDWEEGYRAALADTLGVYQAALEKQEEEEAGEARLESKAVRTVLTHLAEGAVRVTALAERISMDAGQVSRVLGELRAMGLVEIRDAPDGRSKPHVLTLRGQRLAKRLENVREVSSRDRSLLRLGMEFFGQLLMEGRVQAASALELATRLLGQDEQPEPGRALKVLEEEGAKLGLLHKNDEVYVHADLVGMSEICRRLTCSVATQRPPEFMKKISAMIRPGQELVVRTGVARDSWRLFLTRGPSPTERYRILTSVDLRTDTLPREQGFILLYDNLPQLKMDYEDGTLEALLALQPEKMLCLELEQEPETEQEPEFVRAAAGAQGASTCPTGMYPFSQQFQLMQESQIASQFPEPRMGELLQLFGRHPSPAVQSGS